MSDWPRPSFVTGSNPKDEEERLEFLRLLRDFLIHMKKHGITAEGNLHEEVNGFERRYQTSMTQIVQQCVAEGTDARVLRTSAELVAASVKPLVESLERMAEKVKKGDKVERSEPEKVVEEIYARTLFGVLSVVVFPKSKEKLVEYTTELNSALFARYLNALEHKCSASEECHCADRTPIEALIETSALIASAKTAPELFSKTMHLFYPYYKKVANPKWSLACNLLFPRFCADLIRETYSNSLLDSIEKLLESGNIVHVATIQLGPGHGMGSLARSEPSDFVMITLELCVAMAQQNHQFSTNQLNLFSKLALQDPVELAVSALELIWTLREQKVWKESLNLGELYEHNARILAPPINFRRIAEIAIAQSEMYQDKTILQSSIDFLNSIAGNDRKLAVLEAWLSHADQSPETLSPFYIEINLVGAKFEELREIAVEIDKRIGLKRPRNLPGAGKQKMAKSRSCIIV